MQNNKANQITSGGRLNPSSSGRSLNEFMRCTKCRCLFAEYFCSRCSSAVYCSVKCQLNDWRHHMDLCIPSLIRVRMPSLQVQQAIEHEPQTRQQGQQAQKHGDQAPEHEHQAQQHGDQAPEHEHQAQQHGHQAPEHEHQAQQHGHQANQHGQHDKPDAKLPKLDEEEEQW